MENQFGYLKTLGGFCLVLAMISFCAGGLLLIMMIVNGEILPMQLVAIGSAVVMGILYLAIYGVLKGVFQILLNQEAEAGGLLKTKDTSHE